MSSTCQLSLPLPVMRWATSPSFLALQLLSHIQHEHEANQQLPFSKWSIQSICDHAGLSSWQQLSHLSPLSRPSAGPQLRLFPVWTEFATLTLLMSLKGCSLHIFFFLLYSSLLKETHELLSPWVRTAVWANSPSSLTLTMIHVRAHGVLVFYLSSFYNLYSFC